MWADITHTHFQRPRRNGIRALLDTASRTLRGQVVQRVQDWRRRRHELAELMRLDDRDLADLGIARGDFGAIVAGTYRREGDAFQVAQPGRFALDEHIPPSRPQKPEMLPVPSLFWPFWPQPSWYERYWFGEK